MLKKYVAVTKGIILKEDAGDNTMLEFKLDLCNKLTDFSFLVWEHFHLEHDVLTIFNISDKGDFYHFTLSCKNDIVINYANDVKQEMTENINKNFTKKTKIDYLNNVLKILKEVKNLLSNTIIYEGSEIKFIAKILLDQYTDDLYMRRTISRDLFVKKGIMSRALNKEVKYNSDSVVKDLLLLIKTMDETKENLIDYTYSIIDNLNMNNAVLIRSLNKDKLYWNGSLDQLAQLFEELKKNKWINFSLDKDTLTEYLKVYFKIDSKKVATLAPFDNMLINNKPLNNNNKPLNWQSSWPKIAILFLELQFNHWIQSITTKSKRDANCEIIYEMIGFGDRKLTSLIQAFKDISYLVSDDGKLSQVKSIDFKPIFNIIPNTTKE